MLTISQKPPTAILLRRRRRLKALSAARRHRWLNCSVFAANCKQFDVYGPIDELGMNLQGDIYTHARARVIGEVLIVRWL